MKINLTKDNIICGDNLDWLKDIPDESVDLCYIDPPFFSNRNYEIIWGNGFEVCSFGDRFAGGLSHYIEWMRPRIELIHRKLKRTGSIFLHCDWHASHRLRCVLDDVFGEDKIRNEIIWRRANAHNDPGKCGVITDTILFYSKTTKPKWNPVHMPYSEKYIDSHWGKKDEDGRRYRLVPLDAPRHGDGGNLVYEWKGKWPAQTRTWSCVKSKMIELDRQGKIAYTKNGTPNLKRYIDETPGLPIQNLWDDIPPVNPMAKERLGYPTQKPEALLKRIIECASNPGDIVLDCFAGGGTTAKVARTLGRKFIVGDVSPVACKIIAERIARECHSHDFELKNLPQSAAELRSMDGHRFAAVVCETLGWQVNQRMAGDAGVDGWDARGFPVQVKNHKAPSGRPDMMKFYGALAKQKKKRGVFVAWEFSREAMDFVAEMKRENKVEIVAMKCSDVFGALLLDRDKTEEVRHLFEERLPKAWREEERSVESDTRELLRKSREKRARSEKAG